MAGVNRNGLPPLVWAGALTAVAAGLRAAWSQCTVLRMEDGILQSYSGWFPVGRGVMVLDLLDVDRIDNTGTTVTVVDVHGDSVTVACPLPTREVAERVTTFLQEASDLARSEMGPEQLDAVRRPPS